MATNKSIAFAAPYTSTTFNAEEALNVGQNGVMTGMAVSTSGSVVTIQPGSFVQNGLIVTASISLSASLPATLVAPYSVVVTTSSSIQNTGEVITPTFVQRPEDVSPNSVIVADWDGYEWISRPKLQITELVQAAQARAVEQEFVGINHGFDVTVSGGNLDVTAGTLIDQQGSFFTKTLATVFAQQAADIDGLYRVDEVLYRRPNDDPNRSGTLQYVTGPVFNAGGTVQVLHETQIVNSSAVNVAKKIINVPSSNESIFLHLSGTNIQLSTAPDLMSTFVSPTTIATGASDFDAVLNPSGNIDIVYTSGNSVFYMQVTVSGSVVYAASSIATHSVATSNPRLRTVGPASSFAIHVVYEITISGSVHQLWYVRISNTNTVLTAQLLLVDLSAVVTNPSLDKDDNDSLLLLAYENSTTGKVYFREYDASTATALAIPTQIGVTLELETDTLVISTSSVLPANGSTRAHVHRAANKETYVFWLQNKGSGNYGVAVYNRNNLATFGHMAYIQDLVVLGENILTYSVQLDGLNNAYFLLGQATSTWKASLQLETAAILGTTTAIDANTPTGVATNFNAKGSLVQLWSYVSGSNTIVTFAKTTAGVFTNLRSFSPIHTDVLLAHFRSPDNAFAARGSVIDEHQAITRLYEFLSCLGANGQLSWGNTGVNQLAFTSPITLNFFNRVSTYSISAIPGGITIGNGQVAYVQIPDSDATSTLTLNVASFGSGILDRHTRNTFPLFWNVGGFLYLRFAPFRLTTGEIINIGDQISQELQTWLGLPSLVPTTHSYSSTVYISDSESHEAALGTLDAAIATAGSGNNQDRNTRLINGGTWSWNSTSGVLAWAQAANISIPGLADSVNAISTGSTTITDGQVAYVSINRSGPGGSIAVSVATESSLSPAANTVIIARRVGSVVFVGANASQMTLQDGEFKLLQESGYVTSFTATAGQTLTTGQVAYISEGGGSDGGRTLGDAYPLDCSAGGAATRSTFAGFVTTGATVGQPTTIVSQGFFKGSSLVVGAVYYADPVTPGAITTVQPSGTGQRVVPVAIAITSTTLLITSGQGSGNSTSFPIFSNEPSQYGNGVQTAFVLTQIPLSSLALYIYFDGVFVSNPSNVAWSLSTQTVNFVSPPPNGVEIDFEYLLTGQSYLAGGYEVPGGGVNGVHTVFTVVGNPISQSAARLFVDGLFVPYPQWTLNLSMAGNSITLATAPTTGQSLDLIYFTPVGAAGGGSVTGASNVGTGAGVFYALSGSTLEFKSIKAGTNVTVTDDGLGTITVAASGGGSGIEVHGSASSPVSIVPSAGITPTSASDQVWWVQPSSGSGAVPITANPQIAAGASVGIRLTLVGVSGTTYLTITDGTGTSQNGPVSLNINAITYFWDGSSWFEISRRN